MSFMFFNNYLLMISGSSLLEVFCKKAVLRNLAKFTGKYLCQSLFFNKHLWWLLLYIYTPPTHWLTRTFLNSSYKLVFLQKRY